MKLLFLSLGYVISLLIFQAGFLLKRKELHMRSSCSDARVDSSGCWMREQYGRVILVIIDALRYDFIAPPPKNGVESPFLGQMKFTHTLYDRAFVSPIIADPPTTTLQRLKALTTGTLPTFIDASDNFSPDAEIQEDNILDQLKSREKNATLLGDDTWISLYPRRFSREFAMPSFDVHDLHSVDNEIIERLPGELSRTDSQLLIAHFLGVDHCGHKYGPNHPEMSNKLSGGVRRVVREASERFYRKINGGEEFLRQMDRTLKYVVENMRADDLLVVMGDHGMTSNGDHGGDSDDEVTAGLMVFSPSHTFSSIPRSIRQIDLLPTLSLLLGLPIPFSNLGTFIHELFPEETRKDALQLNFEQIMRFTKTYAAANPMTDVPMDSDATSSEEQITIMTRLQDSLRAAWTQFDGALIRIGLASIFECLLYNLSTETTSLAQWMVRSGMLFLQLSTYFGGSENISVPMLEFTLAILIVFHLIRIVNDAISAHNINVKKVVGSLFIIFHAACLFSNSFTIYEAHVVRYLIQGFIVLTLILHVKGWGKKLGGRLGAKNLRSLLFTDDIVFPIVVLFLLRLEPLFHRCREEEWQCESYFPTSLPSSLSPDARVGRYLLGVISAIVLNWIIGRECEKIGGVRQEVSLIWPVGTSAGLTRAFSWPCVIGIVLHWGLSVMPYSAESVRTALLGSAWFVYAITFLCLAINILPATDVSESLSRRWCVLQSLTWIILLLLGDGIAPALLALSLILMLIPRVVLLEWQPAAYSLLMTYGFYSLGHSPTLTAIPWTAAFVGVPGNFFLRIVPASLVLLHLFAIYVLVPLRLSIQPSFSNLLPQLLAATATRSLCAAAAAAVLRRHLMVWKIFAPRFIFESVSLIVFLVAANLVALLRKRFV